MDAAITEKSNSQFENFKLLGNFYKDCACMEFQFIRC